MSDESKPKVSWSIRKLKRFIRHKTTVSDTPIPDPTINKVAGEIALEYVQRCLSDKLTYKERHKTKKAKLALSEHVTQSTKDSLAS